MAMSKISEVSQAQKEAYATYVSSSSSNSFGGAMNPYMFQVRPAQNGGFIVQYGADYYVADDADAVGEIIVGRLASQKF